MTTESVAPEVLHVWALYMQSGEEARRRGDRRTGTDHLLLGLLEDPSIESVLGVSLRQARHALESLDQEALGALGIGPDADAPPLRMRAVPKRPTFRAVMGRDRLRMTPAAKKVLENAVKPNPRKTQVTAQQVLAEILTLQPPDPAGGAVGRSRSERLGGSATIGCRHVRQLSTQRSVTGSSRKHWATQSRRWGMPGTYPLLSHSGRPCVHRRSRLCLATAYESQYSI